jgi:hypothetical protein
LRFQGDSQVYLHRLTCYPHPKIHKEFDHLARF